jgi:hypothetical protein
MTSPTQALAAYVAGATPDTLPDLFRKKHRLMQ